MAQDSAGRGFSRYLVPRGFVDDENLVGVIVHLLAQMEIIKVGRILIAEEQAHAAVPVILRRAKHVHFQHEIADINVPQQRDVQRAAIRRFVLALLKQAVRLAAR